MNVNNKKKLSQEELKQKFLQNGFQPPESFNFLRQKHYGDVVFIPIREIVGYAVCDVKTERATYVSATEDSDEDQIPPPVDEEKNFKLQLFVIFKKILEEIRRLKHE